MGLLRWLRGDSDNPSATTAAGALIELDANLSPAKRNQLENLETLEALREEEGDGDGDKQRLRRIDLESGRVSVSRKKPPETLD